MQISLNNETLASICPLQQMSPKHHGLAMIAADADLVLQLDGQWMRTLGDLTGNRSAI
jgi:hypothetical protein